MSSGHILVVDDEPDIRNLVKEILEDEGFEVSVAESGETARQARRMRRPDLILLDIWMDDIDGITLLREWSEGGSLPYSTTRLRGQAAQSSAGSTCAGLSADGAANKRTALERFIFARLRHS